MFCRECGKEINDKAVICVHCGVPTVNQVQKTNSDAATRMLLPVDRSGLAIAAGYLGLFSPLAVLHGFSGIFYILVVFAPLAIIFGILGVRDIKKNKDKHGMGRAVFGIVMGTFSILLWYSVLRK